MIYADWCVYACLEYTRVTGVVVAQINFTAKDRVSGKVYNLPPPVDWGVTAHRVVKYRPV